MEFVLGAVVFMIGVLVGAAISRASAQITNDDVYKDNNYYKTDD